VCPKFVTIDAGIKTEELLSQSSQPQREPSLEVSQTRITILNFLVDFPFAPKFMH